MTLFFQQPLLLALLALAGLPLLVHLLSRSRPPSYRFSNVAFLRRVTRRTARLTRPRDWLLLVLRTLAVLALAAAFSSPVLISRSAALPGEPCTAILLIDRSASMAAREGVGSRFDLACAEASRFLDSSRPDHANLIWIDSAPHAVFPSPGPNRSFLTDLLKSSRPVQETGALPAAFALAQRQLSSAQGHRELIVISDFQATAWKNFSPSIPENVVVRTHCVATAAPPNSSISQLLAQPTSPVAGQNLTVLARVRNFSPDSIAPPVTLDADGARQTQTVTLPPWGESECAFTLKPSRSGPLALTASLSADAFPLDDSRHAAVPVRESLRLVFDAPPDSPDARVLTKLAAALGWLEISASSVTTGPSDYQFIPAWHGETAAELRQSALDGTTVIVRPAADCPPAALRQLLGLPESPSSQVAEHFRLETSLTGWQATPAETHPANQLFRSGDFGNPFAGTFRERLRLPDDLTAAPDSRLIAQFADSLPAIVEFPTPRAPILIWTLPLDPAKTDWPTQNAFLPCLAEMLLHSRPTGTTVPTSIPPGQPLSWAAADPTQDTGSLILVDPAGAPMEISSTTTASGALWTSKLPAAPGIHRWQISGQSISLAAVNFPESESDLRSLPVPPTFGKRPLAADSLSRQAALARGLPLWPWLVLTAIVALLVEPLIRTRSRAGTHA